MSNKGNARPAARPVATTQAKPSAGAARRAEGFRIPYPAVLLAIIAFALYIPSLSFGLTELDDSIFIKDFHTYNEDISNLIVSFQRGLFDAVKDPYYRPLFLDSMILNYKMSNGGENIFLYHLLNVLFHVVSVVLLYRLLLRLRIGDIKAFILSLFFAVLPVLTQDVAWIPGRNDTMLAIFVLAFFMQAINFSDSGHIRSLAFSFLFLLLAFFTKETAVFAAPAAWVLLWLYGKRPDASRNSIMLYGSWVLGFIIWFAARKAATVQTTGAEPGQAIGDMLHRLPILLQYLGKIFFPVNLSVFPMQNDTVYYYGVAALVLLVAFVYLNKQRNWKFIIGGIAIFILLLIPALIVPRHLNEQIFEHRLYLPMIGILLILSQTSLLNNKLQPRQLVAISAVVTAAFAVVTIRHEANFKDPQTFWAQAVNTSPNSGYASMMLAARLDKDDFERSCALFRRAYALNPNEKYINYYYGVMLQKKDSVLASEPYLLREKKITNFFECDFYLTRVAVEKKDMQGAIGYLTVYLTKNPQNPQANNNLLLLYMNTNQPDKAREQAHHMQQLGMPVPGDALKQLGI